MSIHLVMYSSKEPYHTVKKLIIESVSNFTKKNLIVHDYTIEKIIQRDWFQNIMILPILPYKLGYRDGFYNSWKPFIIREVYNLMKDGDILYYVDSSSYFRTGFTENIDKLCDIASEKLRIAGSVGEDAINNGDCCNNISVWNKIIPNSDNTVHLNKMHVLNSWFLFKKCESNNNFINDWVYFSCYTDKDINYPLVTYHHTGDQSIFNILVIKHKFPVFYHKKISHDENKNKNIVLNIINNTTDVTEYFIYL